MHARRGFSLTELTIIVTIILIFSTISITTYTRINRTLTFEKNIEQFVSLLQRYRQLALYEKPLEGYTCNEFSGYRISKNDNTITMCCSTGCVDQYNGVPGYELDNTVLFQTTASGSEVWFRAGQSTVFQEECDPDCSYVQIDSATPFVFSMKSKTLSQCVDIEITVRGVINQGDWYDCP